jgi:hypothetical protein
MATYSGMIKSIKEIEALSPTGIGSATAVMPYNPAQDSYNLIFKWNTKALHDLFGLEQWENTQLYGVLAELDLLSSSCTTIAGGSLVRHLLKTDIFKGDLDIWPEKGSCWEGCTLFSRNKDMSQQKANTHTTLSLSKVLRR